MRRSMGSSYSRQGHPGRPDRGSSKPACCAGRVPRSSVCPMTRPNPPEVPPGVGDSDPHADQEPRLRPGLLFRWGAFASLGVLATLAAAAAVYTARAVLIRAAIALFVAISLDPAVRWLVRKGVRRSVAVTIIFVIVLALTAAFLMSVIPAMVSQFRGLVDDLPRYLSQLQDRSSRYRELSDRYNLTKQIQSVISSLPSRLGSGLFGLTGRIFDVVIDKVGAYMIGNILISLVAGLASFVCFTALGVPFSVPLAFVVALTDLIPMIGATLGAIIAVVLTLFASKLWPTTVLVALFFLVYQQIENYLIAPRILRSTVNLSAVAVLVAGLIGATALGLVGALMAIPVAAAMRVLLTEQLEARDAAEAKGGTGPAMTGLAATDKASAEAGGPGAEAAAGATGLAAGGDDEVHSEAEAREELRPSEDEDQGGAPTSVTSRGSAGDDPRSRG